jgi:phage-related protein
MAPKEESPSAAELHFEGDSLEVLSSFPDEVKRALGFSLRQLQIGREPTSQTRSMSFHRLHGTGRSTFRGWGTRFTYCTVLRRRAARLTEEISRLPGSALR